MTISDDSSPTPDPTSPAFIEQGDELVCAVGDLTLRVLGWDRTREGIKTTISADRGGEVLARERVTLDSGRSRQKIVELCPEDVRAKVDKALVRLHDEIRARTCRAAGPRANPAPPVVKLTPEDESEALALLKNPELLLEFLNDTEKLDFVGEEDNKAYLYLAYTSRLLDSPINTTAKGESSAGKNRTTESVADFMPPESVIKLTGATAKAFFYTPRSLKNKVIMIAERPGSEDSDYSIRTMQSEKQIVFWVPQKGEDGAITTQEKIVEGPAAFVETTTKTHLHAENETRNFDIYIDESEGQTQRIFAAQDRRYTDPPHPELKQRLLKKWHNAQRMLRPLPVLIPFANKITFPTKPLRVRRDRPRFISLIEASALLHQHQRNRQVIHDREYVIASVDDYRIARELAIPILKQVLRGATPKCGVLVKTAEELGAETESFTVADLEKTLKWDRKTVTKYCKEAERLGCLAVADPGGKGRGHAARFTFARPVEDVVVALPDPETLMDESAVRDTSQVGAAFSQNGAPSTI